MVPSIIYYREKEEDDEDDDDDHCAFQLQERLVILVAAVTKNLSNFDLFIDNSFLFHKGSRPC